jgi:hypothetical protein
MYLRREVGAVLPMLNRYLKYVVVAVFVLLVSVQAGKMFVLDEIDFPLVAKATSVTLRPVYYRGELNPAHVGLYHPTLYINALAAFIKTLGFSEVSVRMFGVVCVLLSAMLLVLILRQLIGRSASAELLLLGIFLLNPYTIANTTLPDIDSTVLPVLLLLFVFLCLRYVHEKRDTTRRTMLVLSAAFALTLWAKLTTPLVLPLFLLGVLVISGIGARMAVIFASKMVALGGAAFLVTYYAYCRLLRLPFDYTFTFLLQSFSKGTSGGGGRLAAVADNLISGGRLAYWFTLPLVSLFALGLVSIMLDTGRDERSRLITWVVLLAASVTLVYVALIAPFGGFFKYPFPVFGLLVVATVAFIRRRMNGSAIDCRIAAACFAAGFVLDAAYFRDDMFKNAVHLKVVAAVIALGVLASLVMRRNRGGAVAGLLVLYLAVFAIGFQTSVSRVQAVASYSTKYEYGQAGMDRTIEYLKTQTRRDEAIWSMKDVGHYTNDRYYENYAFFFDPTLENDLVRMLRSGRVRYFVATTGIGQDRIDVYPRIERILEANAIKVKAFGNYVIYRSKATGAPDPSGL